MRTSRSRTFVLVLMVLALVVFSISQEAFTQEYTTYDLNLKFAPSVIATPDGNWNCSLNFPHRSTFTGFQENGRSFNYPLSLTELKSEHSVALGKSIRVSSRIRVAAPIHSLTLEVEQSCYRGTMVRSGSHSRFVTTAFFTLNYVCSATAPPDDFFSCSDAFTASTSGQNSQLENFLRAGSLSLHISNRQNGYQSLGTNCGPNAKANAIIRISGNLRQTRGEDDFSLVLSPKNSRTISLKSKTGQFDGDLLVCGELAQNDRCIEIKIIGTDTDILFHDTYRAVPQTVCLGQNPKSVSLIRKRLVGPELVSAILIQRIR